jgi:hypothetical protein
MVCRSVNVPSGTNSDELIANLEPARAHLQEKIPSTALHPHMLFDLQHGVPKMPEMRQLGHEFALHV